MRERAVVADVPVSPESPTDSGGALERSGSAAPLSTCHEGRKRGRPLEMLPQEVLRAIRDRSEAGALFRIHFSEPGLYARARRLYGSWARALAAAGVDHGRALAEARRRSLEARRSARPESAR